MAEAVARVNGRFGKQLLAGSAWNVITYNNTTLGTNLGDFTLNVTNSAGNSITLTVSAKAGTGAYGAAPVTKTISKPGSL